MYPGSYEALNLNPQSTPHDYVSWILWSHKLQSTPHTYVALNLNPLLTLMYLGPYKALNLNHPPPFHFSLHPCVNIRNRMNRFRNIYYIGHLKICFICRVIHKIISLEREDLFGALSFFEFIESYRNLTLAFNCNLSQHTQLWIFKPSWEYSRGSLEFPKFETCLKFANL